MRSMKENDYDGVKYASSLVTALGDPVRRPSSFSAFAYQSGMLRSLPGALCN